MDWLIETLLFSSGTRRIVLHAPDGRPVTCAPLQVGALRAACGCPRPRPLPPTRRAAATWPPPATTSRR
jgi:hypothetical protein